MRLYKEEKHEVIYQTQVNDPFFNYVTELMFSRMTGPGRLLDMGCGSGRNIILAAQRGFEGVGIDINSKSLEVAGEYAKRMGVDKKTRFIRADLRNLTLLGLGKFDYVMMQEVIEHVEDYQALIDLSYRLLKKGGRLLLSTPNDPSQWNLLDEYAEHVRRFRPVEIRSALKEFSRIEIFTVGFPIQRLTITIYDLMLRILKRQHKAKLFRRNDLFHALYFTIGAAVMNFDGLFNGIHMGTTIVAGAEK
ncbi:hypothetical protein A2Z33_04005 [Candidatus Gottesmanbacteria bacterium RBG_16_52_11]|uniref:Methyltransferase domain-containing protein n=1 Tax=Candidatus Gottesmanbacteria bacterium RBG_16_52_11 TaxID=1798374 RepID=A0A1F5YVY9_9BACT|nr:MAG: hypothetical protein A2Z33_04005 [Candidatus Gottesmanbacteria bacterium RBG_16_52_11]